MKTNRTYYQILYVHTDAPTKIIQSSYRTLMQQMNAHPDRGGDAAEAALINRAYAVLSDEKKRKAYDREISRQPEPVVAAPAAPRAEAVPPAVGPTCPFCSSEHPHKESIPKNSDCPVCDSPLGLEGQDLVDSSGQRKTRRIGQRTTLSYYVRWPQSKPHTGTTMNVSPRGLMFQTSIEIPVDSILKIDGPRFKAIAQVINCREAGKFLRPNWQIGVQFITLHFKSSRGTFISDTA